MNYNRLHTANLKAKKTFRKYHGYSPETMPDSYRGMFEDNMVGALGVYRKTKVFCSSPLCCGNPRRKRGTKELTRQELMAPTVTEEW